jgi:transposase
MSFITGFDRKQTALFPQAIDELIAPNNPIRFIDTFVDQLKIVEFGFKDISKNVNGRPSFNPSDLLKLYIYGYMNKIRSSGAPDHNTISNFRKDNPKAIKKVFRATL